MSEEIENPGTPDETGTKAVKPLPWYQVWIKALTQPSIQTYEELSALPQANARTAHNWVFLSAGVGTVIALWFRLGAVSFFLICGGFLFAALLSALVFIFTTAVAQFIARILGGQGTYGKLAFCVSSFLAPLYFLNLIVSSVIPSAAAILGILVGIYTLVLLAFSIKAVNLFAWWKAILISVTWLFLAALLAAAVVLVFGGFFAGVDEAFEEILRDAETR
jgi:hypothetical protein